MSCEIKVLLKEAREAISEKRYEAAKDVCERATRSDPASYMAHVLLGVALQQHADAVPAFRRAIEITPSKPLAWQGLVTYYEKKETEESREQLVQLYEDMLRLKVDPCKSQEILSKLTQLATGGRFCRVLDCLVDLAEDSQLAGPAEEHLATLLADPAATQSHNERLLPTIDRLLPRHSQQGLLLNYAALLSKNSSLSDFIDKISKIESLRNNEEIKRSVCRRVFEEYVRKGSVAGVEQSTLEELSAGGTELAAALVRSVLLCEGGRYKEAYDSVVHMISADLRDDLLTLFLIKCTTSSHDWLTTESLIDTMRAKTNNVDTCTLLDRHLLECKVKLEKWSDTSELCSRVVSSPACSPSDAYHAALCLLHGARSAADERLVARFRQTEYDDVFTAVAHLREGRPQEACQLLENSSSGTSDKWLYLGIVYWKLGEREKSLIPLLKAAKLDPGRPTTFLYLGHYYEEQAGDAEKAKKCYMKSYQSSGGRSDCTLALCGALRRHGEPAAEYEVLRRAGAALDAAVWVRVRLGLHHVRARRWEDAVRALRGAVRADPVHALAWSLLGDAYHGRRSFTSALKCYTRLAELSPELHGLYARTQIATVNHFLGLHQEAIDGYKEVLADNPTEVMALKGISDTLVALAKEYFNEQRYPVSRENAQSALEYTIKAIAVCPQFSCLWKSLGDTFMLLTEYPPKYAYSYVPAELLGVDDKETVYKMKGDIFPLAISCYSRAVKTCRTDTAPLYYDLSVAYWRYYADSEQRAHCRLAFCIAEHCVRAQPGVWQHWNLLGVLSASDAIQNDMLAQYCFLKALAHNRASPEAWSNLGVLYLRRGAHHLANRSLQRAQEVEPDYASGWVAQALVAESASPAEAMDLFRHAARLGYHAEAARGYAHWVCLTIKNRADLSPAKYEYAIEQMQAVPIAIDLMTRACFYHPRDFKMATLRGLLHEHFGAFDSAVSAFEICLETCSSQQEKNAASVNLGRALLRAGRTEQALGALQRVTEATLASACCTALALVRARRLDEAYSALDTVLQWLAESERDKADLLVAMAGVAYLARGADDAKTLLFQSIKMTETPSAHSLLAICALGVLQVDRGLVRLALAELGRRERDAACRDHVAFLEGCLLAREGRGEDAVRQLSEHAAKAESGRAWRLALQLAWASSPTQAEAGARAARLAGPRPAADLLAAASVLQAVRGVGEEARALALGAVRLRPDCGAGWAALAWQQGVAGRRLAATVRAHLQLPRALELWFSRAECELTSPPRISVITTNTESISKEQTVEV